MMGVQGNAPKKQKKKDVSEVSLIDEEVDQIDSPRENKKQASAEIEATVANENETSVEPETEPETSSESSESVYDTDTVKDATAYIRKAALKKLALAMKKSEESAVPEEWLEISEDYLQNFLLHTTGKSSSKVFDSISKNGKIIKFDKNQFILIKGCSNEHLFIVVEGMVEVLTSDNVTRLATLKEGGVFGEVSLLFDVPCTANVKSVSDTTLIGLQKEDVLKIVDDCHMGNPDILDWFVQERYLPTGDGMDAPRFYRRITLLTLKDLRIPLFKDWPDNAIKHLILQCDHTLVLLYPKQSRLLIEDDPQDSLLVIIEGTVEISRDGKTLATVTTTKRDTPFVFGETGVLLQGQTAGVTISAVTCCKVIEIHRSWIMDVVDIHPNLLDTFKINSTILQSFASASEGLHKKYRDNIQFDILYHRIITSECSSTITNFGEMWKKVAQGDIEELDKGENVFKAHERDTYEIVLVIRGKVVERKTGKTSVKQAKSVGKALASSFKGRMIDGDHRPAQSATGLGDATEEPVADVIRSEGDLIVLHGQDRPQISLRAHTRCLVFKIRRTVLPVNVKTSQEAEVSPGTPDDKRDSLDFV